MSVSDGAEEDETSNQYDGEIGEIFEGEMFEPADGIDPTQSLNIVRRQQFQLLKQTAEHGEAPPCSDSEGEEEEEGDDILRDLVGRSE